MTQANEGLSARRVTASAIRERAHDVAVQVTEEFVRRHPDWIDRFGESVLYKRGIEDAEYHLDFLAGAVEAGRSEAFVEYALWAAGVLRSRNIGTDDLIENLEQISRALGLHNPGGADQVTSIVGSAVAALRESDPQALTERVHQANTVQHLYLAALLSGNRRAALNIAEEAVEAGMPMPDVYTDLIQESQYAIGALWAANQITVADEHMATAITQYVVNSLYDRAEPAEATRGRAVITGVEGELHQLGPHIIADALEADGWDVRFLGTNTPHQSIVEAVEGFEPNLVGVSTTMLFNLAAAGRLIEAISAENRAVFVGGAAFAMSGELWRELEAHARAGDVREALSLTRALGSTGA